jgi:hypothetical protein
VRQSRKTVLIWILLLGFFVWLWFAFDGSTHGLTAAKLNWVFLGCVGWSVLLVTPLLVMASRSPPGQRPSRGVYALVAGLELFAGMLVGLPHALIARDAGPALLLGPSVVGTMAGIVALRAWAQGRRRRRLIAVLVRERSRTAADAVLAYANAERSAPVKNQAAVALLEAGFAKDAAAVLRTINGDSDGVRAIVAGNLAMALLQLGDLEAARAAVAGLAIPSQPQVRTWMRIVDARLLASEGRAAEAIAILDDLPATEDPRTLRVRDVTRAHALAARGDREGARALLARGDDLRTIADGAGPAAAIAAELLADAAQPFR